MKKLLLVLGLFLALTGDVRAQSGRTSASAAIAVSTATTTRLIVGQTGLAVLITHWDVIASGTGTIKLVYGTGATCGTGQVDITGAYSLVAQAGISKGTGLPLYFVPAGNSVCVTTSAAVGMQGSIGYTFE
jgi:hypothetical protein